MIMNDSTEKQLKLEIPLNGIDDLIVYQSALLGILGRINIESDDRELKEYLKTIYKLLSYLDMKNVSEATIINWKK